jgi:hypothetical protein
MSSLVSGTTPSGIWIMGEITGDGNSANYPTYLDIPNSGGSYPNIQFRSDTNDPTEAYLTAFDNAGL